MVQHRNLKMPFWYLRENLFSPMHLPHVSLSFLNLFLCYSMSAEVALIFLGPKIFCTRRHDTCFPERSCYFYNLVVLPFESMGWAATWKSVHGLLRTIDAVKIKEPCSTLKTDVYKNYLHRPS